MQKQPRLNQPIIYSVLIGFAIFVFGTSVYALTHTHEVLNPRDLVDNLITAIVTGFIVFLYERRRYRDMRHRLRIIAAMNHHIRNALQSVLWVPYAPDQAQQLKSVQYSVTRIEWALREILPGESPDSPDAQFPSPTPKTFDTQGKPDQAGNKPQQNRN